MTPGDRRRVVVIGGGIIGLTTALWLRKADCDVIVLDAHELASGASRAALGALTPYSDHDASPDVTDLAAHSLSLYPDHLRWLADLTRHQVDLDATGVLEVTFDEDACNDARSTLQRMTERDAPVEWVDSDGVRDLEPQVSTHALGALYYRTESVLDLTQLLTATVAAMHRLGCIVATRTTVTRIDVSHGDRVKVVTGTGSVEADAVILAYGSGSVTVAGMTPIRIERVRGEVIEAVGPPGAIRRCLYSGDGFIAPRRDGRLLLGSNYDVHRIGDDENTDTISIRVASQCLAATTRILPMLEGCQLRRVWKSWRPATVDRQPVVGRHHEANVIFALGFVGLGVTLAPAVAEIVAQLAVGDGDVRVPASIAPERPTLAESL